MNLFYLVRFVLIVLDLLNMVWCQCEWDLNVLQCNLAEVFYSVLYGDVVGFRFLCFPGKCLHFMYTVRFCNGLGLKE